MDKLAALQNIIEKLYGVYKGKGFVSEDLVFETLEDAKIPLYDIDYICDQLLSMGVIIRDDPAAYIQNENEDEDEDEGEYDRSQIDYELVFDEVLAIDKRLAPFIEHVRQIQAPQHREWRNLFPQAKNGNQYAYWRIIEMYLRTVVRMALSYHKKISAPLAETIQEGCIGLIMALKKYEIGRQDVFPTYFPLWVQQNILRETPYTANPSIYFPVYVKDKLYSIYEIVKGHQCDKCRQNRLCPNLLAEAADRLECSTSYAELYLKHYQGYQSIEEMLSEDPLKLSDHGSFETDFLESYNLKELETIVVEVLETLTPKEKRIIEMRMGILDGKEHTLEEIGSVFGVTRERIRQIEVKALQKLRNPSRSRRLKVFVVG